MKKLVVVRGLNPRIAQIEFFSAFKDFKVKFLTAFLDKTWFKAFAQKKIKLVNLKLKPWFLLDPIALFKGKRDHRSWLKIEGLEEHLKEADVVNTSELCYFTSSQAAYLAHKYGKLMTTITWTSFLHPSWFIPPYSLNVRKTMAFTNLFIARSQKSAEDYLFPLKIPASKIMVIYPGVSLKRFYPTKRKTWEGVRILFVGKLQESKGLDDLLAIIPKLKRQFPETEFWICGQGKLEKKVKETAQELPIKYLGFVEYLKIPQIYRSADIFVLPSKDVHHAGIKFGEEFFSYTLMEAMASGLPIVATRCGGIKEEVGEENILVEQGNKEALFNALKELMVDKRMRKELGRKNRQRAEKLFDLKKQARKTEEAIIKSL